MHELRGMIHPPYRRLTFISAGDSFRPNLDAKGAKHETDRYCSVFGTESGAVCTTSRSGNSVRFRSKLLQASTGYAFRRSRGSGGELERTYLCVQSRQYDRTGIRRHGVATPSVRTGREVRSRNRAQSLRLVL